PDLFDRGVIQQRLQGPESTHRGEHIADAVTFVIDEFTAARERQIVVAPDLGASDAQRLVRRGCRIDLFAAYPLANPIGNEKGGVAHAMIVPSITAALPKLSTGCRGTGTATAPFSRAVDSDRPASSRQPHRIDSCSQGGRTDTDRGILLCRFHHMQ